MRKAPIHGFLSHLFRSVVIRSSSSDWVMSTALPHSSTMHNLGRFRPEVIR